MLYCCDGDTEPDAGADPDADEDPLGTKSKRGIGLTRATICGPAGNAVGNACMLKAVPDTTVLAAAPDGGGVRLYTPDGAVVTKNSYQGHGKMSWNFAIQDSDPRNCSVNGIDTFG